MVETDSSPLHAFVFCPFAECLNVLHDDDLEENNETPFQSLVRLHSSYSNYNERSSLPSGRGPVERLPSLHLSRKNAVKYIVDALRSVEDVQQLEEILSCTKKLADDIGLPSLPSPSLSKIDLPLFSLQ